jgi:hypothetical protein
MYTLTRFSNICRTGNRRGQKEQPGDKILSGFNTLQIANGLKERGEVKK